MADETELVALLEHLGCYRIRVHESKDEMGARITATCPMHEDKTPSFMLRIDHPNIWYCSAGCGSGVGLLKLVRNSLLYGPEGRIKQCTRVIAKYVDLTNHTLRKPFQQRVIDEPKAVDPYAIYAYSSQRKKAYDYLASRNITKATAIRHDVGYDRHRERVVIPIKNTNGMINAFIGRIIWTGKRLAKINERREAAGKAIITPYHVYDNVPKECLMLGVHHIIKGEPLYVVEGAMDYMTLRQWGYLNTVSLLGAMPSPWHIKILLNSGCPLRLFLDNDLAGAKGVLKIHSKLKDELDITVPDYADGDKDADEMGKKRFKELADNMVHINTRRLDYFE